MRRYITYKREFAGASRSGLGLEAQERDIQLFPENYADSPYEVVGEFVEVHSEVITMNLTDFRHRTAKKENAVLVVRSDRLVARSLHHRWWKRRDWSSKSPRCLMQTRFNSTSMARWSRNDVHLPADYIGTEVSKGRVFAFGPVHHIDALAVARKEKPREAGRQVWRL